METWKHTFAEVPVWDLWLASLSWGHTLVPSSVNNQPMFCQLTYQTQWPSRYHNHSSWEDQNSNLWTLDINYKGNLYTSPIQYWCICECEECEDPREFPPGFNQLPILQVSNSIVWYLHMLQQLHTILISHNNVVTSSKGHTTLKLHNFTWPSLILSSCSFTSSATPLTCEEEPTHKGSETRIFRNKITEC
jgi:hypothetical protein